MSKYSDDLVDLFKVPTAQAADTDFATFTPNEPHSTIQLLAVFDTAVVLAIRVKRGADEVDMILNDGQAIPAGHMFEEEIVGHAVPNEALSFRISAQAKVLKLHVLECK